MNRFNGVPHEVDTNLIERCQEQLRDYDIHYKGWVEPRDHTLSYIAAAYLELMKQYEDLIVEHRAELTAIDYANSMSGCCGGGCHD